MANWKNVKAAWKAVVKAIPKPERLIQQVFVAVFQTLRLGATSFLTWFWRVFCPTSGWTKAIIAVGAILLLCIVAILKS